MGKDHNSNGKFAKGNQAAKGLPEIRELRNAIKAELVRSVASLLKPWQTLIPDMEQKVSQGMST